MLTLLHLFSDLFQKEILLTLQKKYNVSSRHYPVFVNCLNYFGLDLIILLNALDSKGYKLDDIKDVSQPDGQTINLAKLINQRIFFVRRLDGSCLSVTEY